MTGVLDDALGFPYAAGDKDIIELWEACANKFLLLALQCFAAVSIPVQEKNLQTTYCDTTLLSIFYMVQSWKDSLCSHAKRPLLYDSLCCSSCYYEKVCVHWGV